MQLKIVYLLVIYGLLTGCNQSSESQAGTEKADVMQKPEKTAVVQTDKDSDLSGQWRAVLQSPGGELPFGMQITKVGDKYQAVMINGKERADTSHVNLKGNSIEIGFDWYDARINAVLSEDGKSMQGQWSKTTSGERSVLPFKAMRGYSFRFASNDAFETDLDVSGAWRAEFKDEDGISDAVAEFSQVGKMVSGTFLTPTGDYRFLEGDLSGNTLRLSTFDGAHAFLFTAQLQGGQLVGDFWSRDTYHATWSAEPTDMTVQELLPDSWDMVKMTSKDNTVSFAFENIEGQLVQLSDQQFAGKPVLINLFGTWCPNCNDEAPVLVDFYDKYHSQGLEIVGLAFEFTGDAVRDKKQIAEFKKRYGIEYPLLLAGTNDKEGAAETLGFIDKVVAYPTSIFLDHNHKVVDIHSGFTGPGTGEHYTQLVAKLEQRIQELISAYQADVSS